MHTYVHNISARMYKYMHTCMHMCMNMLFSVGAALERLHQALGAERFSNHQQLLQIPTFSRLLEEVVVRCTLDCEAAKQDARMA